MVDDSDGGGGGTGGGVGSGGSVGVISESGGRAGGVQPGEGDTHSWSNAAAAHATGTGNTGGQRSVVGSGDATQADDGGSRDAKAQSAASAPTSAPTPGRDASRSIQRGGAADHVGPASAHSRPGSGDVDQDENMQGVGLSRTRRDKETNESKTQEVFHNTNNNNNNNNRQHPYEFVEQEEHDTLHEVAHGLHFASISLLGFLVVEVSIFLILFTKLRITQFLFSCIPF